MLPGRRDRARSSRPTAPARPGLTVAVRAARRRCAATPATGPQLGGHTPGRHRGVPGRDQGPRARSRSSGWPTSPGPAPATGCGSPAGALADHQDGARPLVLPRGDGPRALAERGVQPHPWRDRPAKDEPNPYAARDPDLPWPMSHQTPEVARRQAAATLVADAAEALAAGTPWVDETDDMVVLARVQEWDDELTRLVEEASRDRVAGDRRTPALEPVRHGAGPAARRPRRLRRRPGPPDAAPAVAGGAVRHPLPCLGREPVRAAGPLRPRRPARAAATPASTTTPTSRS